MSNPCRKAQSGIELLMLVSYSLLAFSVIYIVILQNNIVTINEKRNFESERIAERVSFELDIATSIGDGYTKNITLPDNLLGETYNIIAQDNLVIINASQSYATRMVTINITGTVTPGSNLIENREGSIYVSQ